MDGNLGIGASVPQATLVIQGNVGIGYTGANQVIPANGLAVAGNVGIGATTANSNLFVNGGVAIGSNFNVTAPANGLVIQGNVGIGISAPSQIFQINQNSSSFAVTSSGNVGIGTTTPGALLDLYSSTLATGTAEKITVSGLTTGLGLQINGGSAMTTGSGLSLASNTYIHTASNDVGAVESITFTDASTNANTGGVTAGVSVASTVNTTGAGTKEVDAYRVAAPTFTNCVTGACRYCPDIFQTGSPPVIQKRVSRSPNWDI